MNKYELVVILNAGLSQDQRSELKGLVEDHVKGMIKDTDEIGMLDLANPINKATKAYFISYLLEGISWEKIDEIKKTFKITKGLDRYVFFKMWANEEFLKFTEVNKQFALSEEEKEKLAKENEFKTMEADSKRN